MDPFQSRTEEIIDFWFPNACFTVRDESSLVQLWEGRWFAKGAAQPLVDEVIGSRFAELLKTAEDPQCTQLSSSPLTNFAKILVWDQFTR